MNHADTCVCQKAYTSVSLLTLRGLSGGVQRLHAACVYLHHCNPARGTQQLVVPLTPLVQLARAHGVAAQVQEYLGSFAEALAGKVAGSVRNARAVGKELPAKRLVRIVSEQLDLQHVRVAGGAELIASKMLV